MTAATVAAPTNHQGHAGADRLSEPIVLAPHQRPLAPPPPERPPPPMNPPPPPPPPLRRRPVSIINRKNAARGFTMNSTTNSTAITAMPIHLVMGGTVSS